jgi:CRP-like cAMP-binding protein
MSTAIASFGFDRFARTSKVSVGSPTVSPEVAALQSCAVLSGVPGTALQALASVASLRSVSRGAVVVPEATASAHVLFVVRGRLRAVRRAANGREVAVESLGAGEVLADAAFAPDGVMDSDWEAAEATTLLLVPREAWLGQLRATPEVAVAMATRLLGRLQRAKDLSVALVLSDVEARVIAALVRLARQEGIDDPEGRVIPQRPTQQDIANQIGACRETVSRTVSDLIKRGLLTPRGRSLLLSRSLLSR